VIIPAGGYAVFWADNETSEGIMHTNFTLESSGGYIGLFDADRHGNAEMTSCSFGEQTSGQSYGRLGDDSETWTSFPSPTPGATNGEFLCGDPNCDLMLNILDVVYLINYLYKMGPGPSPPEAADVNEDTLLNILDVVHLINFLYKNGPVPDCP
jgi:hypothetical protein